MNTTTERISLEKPSPITELAQALGLSDDEYELYGRYKAKLSTHILTRLAQRADGKLILVASMTPTSAGEGKTVTAIGLGQSLGQLGKQAFVALREPSIGPVFGVKGGSTGGGRAKLYPDDINLHCTGDLHAVAMANNLLCTLIDNHLHHGNALRIDTRRIHAHRCVDMNDRALRSCVVGMGGRGNSVAREETFLMTSAVETMAVFCLAENLADLHERLGRMLVAFTVDGAPVCARDFNAQGAMTALLRDAFQPNLVQTTERTPALVHGTPFASAAHGCSSVHSTRMALRLADFVVTESGFASEMGFEKFMDIKSRQTGIWPAAVVLVATVRALKYSGGCPLNKLAVENTGLLQAGFCNLRAHIENIQRFGLPLVVAVNRFESDTARELEALRNYCVASNVPVALSDVYAEGGAGGLELAHLVMNACAQSSQPRLLYEDSVPLRQKLKIIAQEMYGAKAIELLPAAEKDLVELEALGLDRLPICMSKTQFSLSDQEGLRGRPSGFTVTVCHLIPWIGAGYIVAQTGGTMNLLPGLPKEPFLNRFSLDLAEDADGNIRGPF